MKKLPITIMVIAGILFSLTASAENRPALKATNTIEPLPRDLEISLPSAHCHATSETRRPYMS